MCNPNLITSLKEFVCHLWRGLSYRWISHMVGEGILAKLKQTWNKKQIFTRVDNLKKDLVTNPSSFRMAMSFSTVTGFQSLWMLIDAILNVSSAVSPSFKGQIYTKISANVPNWVDPTPSPSWIFATFFETFSHFWIEPDPDRESCQYLPWPAPFQKIQKVILGVPPKQ